MRLPPRFCFFTGSAPARRTLSPARCGGARIRLRPLMEDTAPGAGASNRWRRSRRAGV